MDQKLKKTLKMQLMQPNFEDSMLLLATVSKGCGVIRRFKINNTWLRRSIAMVYVSIRGFQGIF